MDLVGKGVNACVIDTPYQCKTDNLPFHKNTIGKIMTSKKGKREARIYSIMNKIDPQHIFSPEDVRSCVPEKDSVQIVKEVTDIGCDSLKKKNMDLVQLLMTNYGKPIHKADYSTILKPKSFLQREVMRLLIATTTLRAYRMSHMDLHSGNILLDNNKLTIIDFGELTPDNKIKEYIQRRSLDKSDYSQFPPELVLLWAILTSKNPSGAIRDLSRLPKNIEKLLILGKDTGRGSPDLVKELSYIPVYYLFKEHKYKDYYREHLYSMRCEALLTIVKLLKKGLSFAYICAMSFVTIDSYAIGENINKLLQKIAFVKNDIIESGTFQLIKNIASQLSNVDLTQRISGKQALIIIRKAYRGPVDDIVANVDKLIGN